MGTLMAENQTAKHQRASDVAFDGIYLEVLSDNGDELFVVGVPDDGPVTINTFGKDVAASLIEAAIRVARSR